MQTRGKISREEIQQETTLKKTKTTTLLYLSYIGIAQPRGIKEAKQCTYLYV